MQLFRKLLLKVVTISNTVLFVSSLLLILTASFLIVLVEPETFPTYFDGFWWVMTTVTTVGYGDYSPVSYEGRAIALVLYILGIGLIGIIIGKVLDRLGKFRKDREEGNIVYKEKGHYIIIGWSHKAEAAVKEMLETDRKAEIVIIDELEKAPLLSENVHYIRGNITTTEVLINANIKEARAVLVFADERVDNKRLGDGQTLLIAAAVEAAAPNVHTIVEVLEEGHIQNFNHIRVDEFIVSHDTISSLFVRSAFRKGISNVYNQLLRRAHGDDLYHVPALPQWKTYRHAFQDLLENGATLIADRNNLSINRMLDHEMPPEAELYVICDNETFNQLQVKFKKEK